MLGKMGLPRCCLSEKVGQSRCAWPWSDVGSQGPRKNSGSHIDASHSRQPLVKGERLVRYEVNAVMQDPPKLDMVGDVRKTITVSCRPAQSSKSSKVPIPLHPHHFTPRPPCPFQAGPAAQACAVHGWMYLQAPDRSWRRGCNSHPKFCVAPPSSAFRRPSVNLPG